MRLTKIYYRSAVFLGVLAFVVQLISGILQLIVKTNFPEIFPTQELLNSITPLVVLIQVPIIGGLFGYIFGVFIIWIYNLTAKHGFTFSGETSEESPRAKKTKKK
jgi:hypothetical protein